MAITRAGIENWESSLDEFEHKLWPLFKERGYSKNTAYMAYMMKQVVGVISEQNEIMQRPHDADSEC